MKEINRQDIHIDIEEIKTLVAQVAGNSYGVVAIGKIKDVKDDKKGKMEEGIFVSKKGNNTFEVDVYLFMAQSIKITEALRECQKNIRYVLDKKYPKLCKAVNVYVSDLR